MRRLLALLLLAPSLALGQVVSCDAPWGAPQASCGGCSSVRLATPTADTRVRVGRWGDWSATWTRFADVPADALVATVPGAAEGPASCPSSPVMVAKSALGAAPAPPPVVVDPPPPAPPVVAQPITDKPICFPSLTALRGKLLTVPQALRVGDDNLLGVWSCQSPTQLRTYWRTFNLLDLLPWVLGDKTDPDAEFATNPGTVIPAGPLTDWAWAQVATYGWKAVAAKNGTTATRPVYPKLANGLRGSTAVPNARVAVGANCWGTRLADAAGKATAYHSVRYLPNIATADPADVLGDVYALCTVTPPSTGSVN